MSNCSFVPPPGTAWAGMKCKQCGKKKSEHDQPILSPPSPQSVKHPAAPSSPSASAPTSAAASPPAPAAPSPAVAPPRRPSYNPNGEAFSGMKGVATALERKEGADDVVKTRERGGGSSASGGGSIAHLVSLFSAAPSSSSPARPSYNPNSDAFTGMTTRERGGGSRASGGGSISYPASPSAAAPSSSSPARPSYNPNGDAFSGMKGVAAALERNEGVDDVVKTRERGGGSRASGGGSISYPASPSAAVPPSAADTPDATTKKVDEADAADAPLPPEPSTEARLPQPTLPAAPVEPAASSTSKTNSEGLSAPLPPPPAVVPASSKLSSCSLFVSSMPGLSWGNSICTSCGFIKSAHTSSATSSSPIPPRPSLINPTSPSTERPYKQVPTPTSSRPPPPASLIKSPPTKSSSSAPSLALQLNGMASTTPNPLSGVGLTPGTTKGSIGFLMSASLGISHLGKTNGFVKARKGGATEDDPDPEETRRWHKERGEAQKAQAQAMAEAVLKGMKAGEVLGKKSGKQL